MGKGRPRKPTSVLKMSGAFRDDRHGERALIEAACTVEVPQPVDLPEDARRFWDFYAPLLEARGVMTAADRETLACYCTAAARRVQAEKIVAAEGLVVDDRLGRKINPWLRVATEAMEHMRKWGVELGLTPASRTKARQAARPTAAESEEKRFFG